MKVELTNTQILLIESRLICINFELRNTISYDKDFTNALIRQKEKLEYIIYNGYIEL